MRDKTFERRFLAIFFGLVASFLLAKAALGAEEPPKAAPAQSQATPEGSDVPWPDAYQERQLPFQRELSTEDYEWLGRVVWQSMQKIVPKEQNRGLSSREIHALVLEMRRNRGEFSVQLEDLLRILGTRSKKCGRRAELEVNDFADEERLRAQQQSKPRGQGFGFDLDRLKK